jgi:deoxyribose-phosphate aldolase
MDQKELIEKITSEVMLKLKDKLVLQDLQKSVQVNINPITAQGNIAPQDVAKYIDHTMLKPEATIDAFDKLCSEAITFRFKSVCVNSSWISYVAKKLRGTGIKVCSVIGFPLGAMDSRAKAFEGRIAIENGAEELDMVINVGALKSRNLKLVEEDIRSVRRAARSTTILKVIIETSLLTDEEKVLACEISKKAEADFVKTCTGFAGGGATVEDISLMRRIVGPNMGVKASGGIRDYDKAISLIGAGANRLGCVSSVAIVTGVRGNTKGSY